MAYAYEGPKTLGAGKHYMQLYFRPDKFALANALGLSGQNSATGNIRQIYENKISIIVHEWKKKMSHLGQIDNISIKPAFDVAYMDFGPGSISVEYMYRLGIEFDAHGLIGATLLIAGIISLLTATYYIAPEPWKVIIDKIFDLPAALLKPLTQPVGIAIAGAVIIVVVFYLSRG